MTPAQERVEALRFDDEKGRASLLRASWTWIMYNRGKYATGRFVPVFTYRVYR